jgi:hypothetical protein
LLPDSLKAWIGEAVMPIRSALRSIIRFRGVMLFPTWVIILGTACGDDEEATRWIVKSETLASGTVHVVNTPPAQGVRPTWRLEEELRIGSVDAMGPTSFGEIKGLAVTEDGRISVLDSQAQELRVFGPTGEYLLTYGGKGGGPGEMEGAYGPMLSPDGLLWVPDSRNARMSKYDPGRGFTISHRLNILSRAYIWRGVMSADGHVLKPSIVLNDERSRVLRVWDSEMTLFDSLPMPAFPTEDPKNPRNSFYWEAPGGMPSGYIGVPYFPQSQEAIDPRGVIWSTSHGDPSYRIVRWVPGGDTTLVIETRREPVPVTAAERDSVIAQIRDQLRERSAAQQDWSKIPGVKPAVTSMFVADDGRLWVRVASSGEAREYDVYERDGRYVGTAVTPLQVWRYLSPIVRGDWFWAVVIDDFGVSYVVRARIRTAMGPS